ncbi:hypothetical protein I6I57_13810 [Brevibacterium casei]|uniref:hypothetical protein n=1 Tax=Brevibacterium TaxID=1696 RepID=UPI00191A7860|nr:hypothetical protein [Brevibacterium casei]QQT68769.1 hypothetical protein I6I57_13810 [Brevibacterium casei]
MNSTARPPTDTPVTRVRMLIWLGTALGVVMLSASLVWLVAPELSPYAARPNPAPIHHLFKSAALGQMAASVLQACIGAAGSAVGLAALFGRRGMTPILSGIAVTIGMVCAVGLTGLRSLAVAGYTLAYSLPLVIIVLLALMMRTLAKRVLTALVGLAAVSFLVLGLTTLRSLYLDFAVDLVDVRFITPLVLMLFAGIWFLIGASFLYRTPGTIGRFVLRHRIAITVVAACCSLPYVCARLSWLTPWPLFGDPRDFDDPASTFVNGLILGAAMLTGGILTLGLVLPWGFRVPRWFGRFGGKPVPVSLAVIPALTVSILFTAAGLDSFLLAGEPSTGLAIARLTTALVFPFWLWGPLLALATWGYALHRRTEKL